MADVTITSPGATSVVDSDGTEYLPDPFGRFTLPGPLMSRLLSSGSWHVWTAADAPAFGPWVPLLPTIAEATDGDLFPCFVDLEGAGGVPDGLGFQAVGADQVRMNGLVAFMTGPSFPDDLAVPDSGTRLCSLPDALMYVERPPLVVGTGIDITTGDLSMCGFNVQSGGDGFGIGVSAWVTGLAVCNDARWPVAS